MMKKKNQSTAGSFTVEAALLMPLILMVILSAIYLTAHTANRASLAAFACEQAISGHAQKTPELFAAGKVTRKETDTEKERSVTYLSNTVYFSGETIWEMEVAAVYKKVKPVSFIRKIRAAGKLAGG